jgi:monovalent cation:H+ antiporter-2, CPA2 family
MHIDTFLQDLAVIMIVAGLVTIIFHQLKQPVVLGYIIAGVILGPHTPPFSFIHDEAIVKTLAEIGVIFLMFSLGLEFNLRKLFKVGAAALIAAVAEIIILIFVGYEIGQFFGWTSLDSLFLGAMLAISSTTIIIKALDELGMKKENFAHTIFGILIIEDILAVAILALLSSIAISGSINSVEVVITLGKLLVFLVSSLTIGILIIPKLISYVASFRSREMLLITALGLCFGFSLLVVRLGYSVALGAFLIGAIVAEAKEIKLIEKLIIPLTDMFSAIFFVSIGLLVDPKVIMIYIIPIIVITLAVVIGKVVVCSMGVFLAGRDGKTSMRVGMGLAQIGEFSFIIASLGMTLKVTSPFLYPIIVAVSAITTLLTPYLIKVADPFTDYIAKIAPVRISRVFNLYTAWLEGLRPQGEQAILFQAIQKALLHVVINLILITAVFVTGSYFSHSIKHNIYFITDDKIQKAIIWGLALIISLPFLIAIYRKLNALSAIITEMIIRFDGTDVYKFKAQRIIPEIISMIAMLGIVLMLVVLSASILPPLELLILVLFIVIILTALLWRWFIKLHSQLQITFMDRFEKKD